MTKLFKKITRSFFWQGLLTSFILTAIFLTNFVLNLDKTLVFSDGTYATARLSHGDIAHVVLTLKHYFDIFLTGDFQNILNVPIFYGFTNSLLFSEPFLLHGLIGFPIYLLTNNILVTFNLLAYLAIATSFIGMFFLTHYFTKRYFPSVVAAIIFSYNPYVFARFPEHMTYYTLIFIPLIFLYIEKSFLEEKNLKFNNFMVFLLLSIQLLTTLTFAVFLSVILPIYCLVRFLQLKPNLKKYFNWGTISGIILLIITTLGFGLTYNNFYSKEPINRGLEATSYYSAWPSDYLLASPNNFLFGGLRDGLATAFPNLIFMGFEISEHNLFWGWTVMILVYLSFWQIAKSPFKKIWISALILLLICVLLSFGPKIFFSYDFYIPGPYLLAYWLDPAFQFLRVASRFAFFSYLFLGLISAFTLVELTKNKNIQNKNLISCLIIGLILLEYWNNPWPIFHFPPSIKQFYSQLNQQKNIKVIMELPMGNISNRISDAKFQFVDSDYMLYASTLHSKKLINGYSSFIPQKYTKRIEYSVINFPNIPKLITLKKWGVDGIVLHKNSFADPAKFQQIYQGLNQVGLKEEFSTSDLIFFNLVDWQPKNYDKVF